MTAYAAKGNMYGEDALSPHHGQRVTDYVCAVARKSDSLIIIVEELDELMVRPGFETAAHVGVDRIRLKIKLLDKQVPVPGISHPAIRHVEGEAEGAIGEAAVG